MKIEDAWSLLRSEHNGAQRRIDADHPLDLYADFEPPNRPGLVLISPSRPPDFYSLKFISIERRQRPDNRWVLRLFLEEPRLMAVFAELCRDIVDYTRDGVGASHGPSAELSLIERWRDLVSLKQTGLDKFAIRGLIGELVVLENLVLPSLTLDEAVSAWTGPLGTDQDFRLPHGERLEVKTVVSDADKVLINGLGQLDSGEDPLKLLVVRLDDTTRDAPGALTAARLIERLRSRLTDAPLALHSFNTLLGFVGWSAVDEDSPVAVRVVRIDEHVVDAEFPRLVATSVPHAISDVTYKIRLPRIATPS